MKKSCLFLALFIILLSACNNSKPTNQQDGVTLKEDSSMKSPNVATNSINQNTTIMKGFTSDIQKDAMENNNFRKVLYTSKHLQLVLMSLKPGEDIGEETHDSIDQFFRFESGNGKCIINGNEYKVKDGDVIVIPAGAKHNIINTDATKALKMYTIYAPPNHKDGITRATKKEAVENQPKFDGKTTE